VTENEWNTCECPLPMLIFLRGDVPPEEKRPPVMHSNHGELWSGAGTRVSVPQCRLFILACAQRLYQFEIDEPSCVALAAYRRHALEGASRDEFFEACQRIQDVLRSGGSAMVSHLASGFWSDDPFGAGSASTQIACTIADVGAKDSVAVTYAQATYEDRFACAFFGGPPDRLWQTSRIEEERTQARLLREIAGDPFRH
jgi:hypothetical protein